MQSPRHYLIEDGTPLDHYVVIRETQSIQCWSEQAGIPLTVLIRDDRMAERCREFLVKSGREVETMSHWKEYARVKKWPGCPAEALSSHDDIGTDAIPEDHPRELKRRIADADANPNAGIPLAEWTVKLKEK